MGDVQIRKRATRKGRRKKAIAAAVISAAAAVVAFAAWLNAALGGPILSAACVKTLEKAERELTAACSEALGASGELVPGLIKSAEDGALIINVDAAALDALMTAAASEAQERLASLSDEAVKLKLGTVLGPAWLSGCGPTLKAGVTPMGTVSVKAASRLTSAGINQTLFTVELRLEARLSVFAAGRSEQIEASAQLPVCSTVIVGEVPQVYTNVANEEDMLNLIPTELP